MQLAAALCAAWLCCSSAGGRRPWPSVAPAAMGGLDIAFHEPRRASRVALRVALNPGPGPGAESHSPTHVPSHPACQCASCWHIALAAGGLNAPGRLAPRDHGPNASPAPPLLPPNARFPAAASPGPDVGYVPGASPTSLLLLLTAAAALGATFALGAGALLRQGAAWWWAAPGLPQQEPARQQERQQQHRQQRGGEKVEEQEEEVDEEEEQEGERAHEYHKLASSHVLAEGDGARGEDEDEEQRGHDADNSASSLRRLARGMPAVSSGGTAVPAIPPGDPSISMCARADSLATAGPFAQAVREAWAAWEAQAAVAADALPAQHSHGNPAGSPGSRSREREIVDNFLRFVWEGAEGLRRGERDANPTTWCTTRYGPAAPAATARRGAHTRDDAPACRWRAACRAATASPRAFAPASQSASAVSPATNPPASPALLAVAATPAAPVAAASPKRLARLPPAKCPPPPVTYPAAATLPPASTPPAASTPPGASTPPAAATLPAAATPAAVATPTAMAAPAAARPPTSASCRRPSTQVRAGGLPCPADPCWASDTGRPDGAGTSRQPLSSTTLAARGACPVWPARLPPLACSCCCLC